MGVLTVRNLDDEIVRALRIRAAEHGRSAEAEHREILKAALSNPSQPSRRAAAAERLAEFRRRTTGRGDETASALLQESRSGRDQALAGTRRSR
jgi:plasmid stability protein